MNTTPDMPISARVTVLEDTVSKQTVDIEILRNQVAELHNELLTQRNQKTNLTEERHGHRN